MSDALAFRPEDRVWPRRIFPVSLAVGLGSLVVSAALVASAYSLGRGLELTFICFVTAALAGLSYVDAVRPWLRGEPVRRRTKVVQPALLLLLVAAFVAAPTTGAAALCGYLAGIFLPIASTVRTARVDQALDDAVRDRIAEEQDATADLPVVEVAAPTALWRPARRVPKVSAVLRETLAAQRERWLAWAAATGVVALGCAAFGASPGEVLGLSLPGLAAMAWVGWRLLRVRLALRDFERAATEPRRAYVVMVTDPSPRTRRPLLGVWVEEPVLASDRLPRADAVYRCDAHQAALVSRRGEVVVHEAWLETGAGARSQPRWVAADAGIALAHRRSLRGPWYLDTLIGTERPARTRPLTMRAPDPTTENQTGTGGSVIREGATESGHGWRPLGWRVALLAATATVLAWVTRAG